MKQLFTGVQISQIDLKNKSRRKILGRGKFVLVWLYKYFDMSVTDESYVDETRVWRTKL